MGMGFVSRERHTGGRCLQPVCRYCPSCRKTVAEKLIVLRNAVIRLVKSGQAALSLQIAETWSGLLCLLDDMRLHCLFMVAQSLPFYQWSYSAGSVRPCRLTTEGMPDTCPFLRSKNYGGGRHTERIFSAQTTISATFAVSDFADLFGCHESNESCRATEGDQRKEGDIPVRFHQFPQDKVTVREYPHCQRINISSSLHGNHLSPQQENDLRAFGESRNNCLFSLEKNSRWKLFQCPDRRATYFCRIQAVHPAAATFWPKLPAFRKPVIGQPQPLHGPEGRAVRNRPNHRRRQRWRMQCSYPPAANVPKLMDTQAFARYAHETRSGKLITCFNQISKYIPRIYTFEESPLPETPCSTTGKSENRCQPEEREYDHRQRGENGRRRKPTSIWPHTGEKMFPRKSAPALPEIIVKKTDIVVGWFYFPASILSARTEKGSPANAKLVIRENPSRLLPYGKIKEIFQSQPMHDEGMRLLSKGIGFICANG